MSHKEEKKISFIANYHTHTKRCGHAIGEDREYVEAAIQAGIQILGFSEHTPYPTGTNFKSGMRILLEDAEDYFQSITALREEYKKDIQIYIGVEAEYFPEHFSKLLDYLKEYPLDYMILGNHFVPDEQFGSYVGSPFTDRQILEDYADNVIAAIQTGKFTYVAHPDLPNYVGAGGEAVRAEVFRRICKAAKEYHIPLEINMLGYMRQIQYPSDTFFKVAAECNNDIVIGMDIHNPEDFFNREALKACFDIAERHGLHVLSELPITEKSK